ncbi:MAG: cell division protein FtsK [Candidatus Amoebophilus sp. 36-38]|nr:MAG: cell division protein FtsK [Candidatus Amoebophilus sp. 36-38]
MAIAQNTYKEKNESPKKQKKLLGLKGFSIDRRLRIALGILLQGIAWFLGIAFISYLVTGKFDQGILESVHELGITTAGKAMHNWLGLVGAMAAYFFMFRWMGITAFLIVPPLYLLGAKLLESRFWKNWSLYKVTAFSLFGILWLNLALGYIALLFPGASIFDNLLGGIAFELGILSDGLLGWGTMIFLLTTLLIFIVYYFNITSLKPWFQNFTNLESNTSQPQPTPTIPTAEKLIDQADNYLPTSSEKQQMSDILELQEEEEENDEDDDIDPRKSLLNKEISNPKEVPLSIVDNNSAQEEHNPHFQHTESLEGTLDNYDPKLDLSTYRYPTIDLLDEREPAKKEVTQEELEQNKDKIIKTLTDFRIGISSIKATIGPTVTLYEIVPEAGVKISKIKNLEDDIALSLSALGIRIIAPIPGKGTIGIEVPNKNREMVPFRDMLGSDKFMKSNMELPIILGKSISNEAVIVDLVRMPHVLIAGATGQGKSVGINVLLASLIYKKHPSQLKLVLVDPKKVELSLFSHLERHFLAKLPQAEEPIITETKKVVHTLNSLCLEMDLRYELLKQAGTRNIKEYNEKFIKRRLNPEKGHRFLPYIVLVIDEFADMMMTAGKEVEMPIARLAQLARAIGIHLVLATQRPSVNVITGIIKANFPVRISFRVTSKVDSRTILDTGGAEQLVGQGDMLLSMNSSIIRLQCPFLDTHEIENVCDYIGAQRGYESAYLLPAYEEDEENGKLELDLGESDPLFEEAARLIVAHQQGSTSLIQRKLKLGYNRAGRLIDQLEAAGIVGPFEGSKAREVLLTDERSLEMLLKNRQEAMQHA